MSNNSNMISNYSNKINYNSNMISNNSNKRYRITATKDEKSHTCEEGGALTPSKDESRGKILWFRVQVHVRPRTNLAI